MKAFAVSFLALVSALIASSYDLFTRIVHEEGDSAANSILVIDAKNFELLYGNYSRIGFHHPGPGLLYVHAAGEWLFYDVLHLVPAPWNGQALAILILNAALVAGVLAIVYSWYPSWTLQAGLGGVLLLFLALYTELISSLWLPFVYFAPFLLLLAAAASVAAGRLRHLWAVALAGGFLIHGHAEFLFFVPVLTLFALWRWRRSRAEAESSKQPLLLAGGVIAVFLFPILLNTILNWPGELPKYLTYGVSHGLHLPWQAAGFALQFWGPTPVLGVLTAIILFAVVPRLAKDQPFLKAGWQTSAMALGLVMFYATVGIDYLGEVYIGIFTRAIPLFMFFLAPIGLTRLRPAFQTRPAVRVATAGLLAAGLLVSVFTESLANRRQDVPGIPAALESLGAAAGGRPIVIELSPEPSWAEGVPLALSAERAGLRMCFTDSFIELIATDRLMCTPAERSEGVGFTISRKEDLPANAVVVGDLGRSAIFRR